MNPLVASHRDAKIGVLEYLECDIQGITKVGLQRFEGGMFLLTFYVRLG